MKKIGLIFDLDGTLLDTLGDLRDAVNYTLAQLDLPPRTTQEIRRFVGTGARNLVTFSLEGRADIDTALPIFQSYYKDHCRVLTAPYPGIPEALAKLADYPMAIVSNKPDGAVKALCADYFPGLYARGETPNCPRKPAPDMVYEAMAELGVEDCIYIGDSEVDVVTAKNAGVPCLSVLWGFRDQEEIEENGGKYFCQDVQQLPEMIEKIIGDRNGQ